MLYFNSKRDRITHPGLWLPVDAYFSCSIGRERMLHIPLVSYGCYTCRRGRMWYICLELWLLVYIHLNIDFVHLSFKGNNRRRGGGVN